jgi:hypothetical protein
MLIWEKVEQTFALKHAGTAAMQTRRSRSAAAQHVAGERAATGCRRVSKCMERSALRQLHLLLFQAGSHYSRPTDLSLRQIYRFKDGRTNGPGMRYLP